MGIEMAGFSGQESRGDKKILPQLPPIPRPILPAICVVIVVLAIYLPTVAPTISWRNGGSDSGELATAVATRGVPHPPGYPTYMVLGTMWSLLPLGGDVAYRLNLLSAVSAASAAGLSVISGFLMLDVGFWNSAPCSIKNQKSTILWGAVFGGLFLALSPLTWSQATITEVYTPGLAALSLFSLLILEKRHWFWAGLVAGLGLGILPQIALAIIGFLILDVRFLMGQSCKFWKSFHLGLVIGLTIFAYLPWRAMAHPLANWGDPSTLERFWWVVSGAQYHHLAGGANYLARWGQGIKLIEQQLTWLGLILASGGGYALWQTKPRELCYLLSLVGLTLLFYGNYPVENSDVYLLPAVYSLALLAGVGYSHLLNKTSQVFKTCEVWGHLFMGLFFVWRVLTISPQVDISADNRANLFGHRILTALPAQAIIVSERDETTFSLWYRQALHERPDVVVIDSRLLWYDWYRDNLVYQYPDLNREAVRPGGLTALSRSIYLLTGEPGKEVIQVIRD